MSYKRYQKIFGIGPLGALISATALIAAWLLDGALGHPQILDNPLPLKFIAIVLLFFGLSLHCWTFFTLKNWWKEHELCTMGPFRFFRHPMYAAWVSFISMAIALVLNSWLYIFWALGLHPLWHTLVKREEKMMGEIFGRDYRLYATKTGRFVPRIFRQ